MAVCLAGCGGGGGGGGATDPGTAPSDPNANIVPSSSVAARCVAPRSAGTLDEDGQPYNDQPGTLANERAWVRAWIDETYLWYQDVRNLGASTLDASRYSSAPAYFDVLKAPGTTASGKAKDAYHYVENTADWVAYAGSGLSYGYGAAITLVAAQPPRKAVVAYTQPLSSAANENLRRGAQILTVDGVDVINSTSDQAIDTLNEGLYPTKPFTHTFTVLDVGATAPRSVTMTAYNVRMDPVMNVKALPAPNQRVGYLQFNDHIAPAEAQLVSAFQQLKALGVSDLVLDLRYNGGGYVDIASELAYMVAGPTITAGKVFEQITFNDKNPFQLTASQRTTPFYDRSQGFSVTAGQALPTLNLSKVYVLVTADTCSASEAVINGLRGVGVTVALIGAQTCGKPYGFFATDNCSNTYFAIQFKGVNQLGFGDYADGMTPSCSVSDDFDHALGEPSERLLAAALGYRSSGVCTGGVAGPSGVRANAASSGPALRRPAMRQNRIYR